MSMCMFGGGWIGLSRGTWGGEKKSVGHPEAEVTGLLWAPWCGGMEPDLGPLQDECTALTTDSLLQPIEVCLFPWSLNWCSKPFHISHLFLVLSICKRLEKVSSPMPLLWARQGMASEWKNRFYKNSRATCTKCVWVFNYLRLSRMLVSG